MAEITSPLGKTRFETRNPTNRQVFSVPDESLTYDQQLDLDAPPLPDWVPVQKADQAVKLTPEQFREYQNKKSELVANQGKVTNEARGRLEALIGIGRLTTQVKVTDYVFTLQTLKSGEQRDVTKVLSEIPPIEQPYEQRRQTLARALTHVNGHPLLEVLGNAKLDSILYFLDEMQEAVIMKLFSEYSLLYSKIVGDLNPAELVDNLKK